jgi:purine-nucleoside phosphorylase
MTLLHVALKQEAKPIIEFFKLRCIQTKPYKIYQKDDIVLAICGMAKDNTLLNLSDVFTKYNCTKAISIGIAGCSDESIKIGELICTNKKIEGIKQASLSTVVKPCEDKNEIDTTLVDMEASYFYEIAKKNIFKENIYILKIVSDYLDITIPKKEFVWKIIEKNLKKISQILNSTN